MSKISIETIDDRFTNSRQRSRSIFRGKSPRTLCFQNGKIRSTNKEREKPYLFV